MQEKCQFGCWKFEFEILAGKMKCEFHGYYASILVFLGRLDGGDASKIQNRLKFGQKYEILSI